MFERRPRMRYSDLRRTVRDLPAPRSYAEFLHQEALRQQFHRRRRRKLLWLAVYDFRPPIWWWWL